MANLGQLRAAVSQLLSKPGVAPILQLNSNTRERAFEAYVFSLILKAVEQAGGEVTLVGIQSGPNPPVLVFRGAPGRMGSRTQDFCYAVCRLNGWDFEVHVDVEYEGTSGATHEVDVSIYDHRRANSVRAVSGSLPNTRTLYGAIECKFYDSSLGTALGRAFVGLADDCGSLKVKAFATNGRSEPLAQYFTKTSRPQPFFKMSPITPANSNRFISTVEQKLRQLASVTD